VREEIQKAFDVIQSGGIILYPTDTVWGIGCDPKNEAALNKINALKQRSTDKNFIVLVESERFLSRYAKVIPDVCYDLIDYAD
jgi:L-threonylcarbamoyladenylate synthase